jgi:hypothetical protein
VAQGLEHLPHKHEVLSSNASAMKKKKGINFLKDAIYNRTHKNKVSRNKT